MATFVLVPGFWLGAWSWNEVTETLRAAGHKVFPLTLTGLAERAHLSSPEVNMETHVEDVLALLRAEDLHEVTLVGHSYAGIVVACAAARDASRLKSLVFVDTGPLPHGTRLIDLYGEGSRFEGLVAEKGDGWQLPLPEWAEFEDQGDLGGLGEKERALFRSRATPQPWACAKSPSVLPDTSRKKLSRTVICCVFTAKDLQGWIEQGVQQFDGLKGPDWNFLDLPTGHWPMFSRPIDLARQLVEASEISRPR